tara:strand:- start:45 stop:587 length:543 start_codon:yes stop_codon:yes gene_type:complete
MANIYDKKERERMDKFLNNPKTKDMTFKEYEKTKKNPPRAKRRRVANFPERSNRGLGLSSMADALDRLSIFPPNEKELAKRKQARDDEKKVDKSIKRQIAKTERDAEKKVNRLEKEREKRIMGGGRSGGGGGFSVLRQLEGKLPGRRKMRKGGIVKTKTKTRKFKGDGIAKKGKTKGRFV